MNNLKKVLALGLALVMLLGMFTIASAAKDEKMVASDLTDWDSVEHKDAVALMVDLGIIKGKDTGAFDPTGTIDRASWSKMVYFAKEGNDDADGFLDATSNLNDIKGNWAESYIKALQADGVVAGDGSGKYNPDSNVTVAEACKMMLTVLGYDAETQGYVNNSLWSNNIMRDAKRYGLMDNVDRTQTAGTALTRENAAEIVYNAVQAYTVKPVIDRDQGIKYIDDYNKVGTLGYDVFGVIRVDATVNSLTNGYANFDRQTYYADGSDCPVVGTGLKDVKASPDVVGQTVSVFVEVKGLDIGEKGEFGGAVEFLNVVSSSVARTGAGADVTYTKGFNWANITNAAKDEFVAEKFAEGAKFYLNGDRGTAAGNYTEETFKAAIQNLIWDSANYEAKPGVVVEFYLDNVGDIKTVKAYNHSVQDITGPVETRTSNGVLQVKVPGVVNTWTDAQKVTGYQGLEEGDVVLYYTTGTTDKTFMIEEAEKITGKVSTWSSKNTITVNGTTYKRSALTNITSGSSKVNDIADVSFSTFNDKENEYEFFLDKSGSICYGSQVTDVAVKDKIALVLAAEWTGTDMTTSAGKLEAKLLFIDGTTQIVTISKMDNLRVVTKKSTVASTAAREIVGGPLEGSKLTDGQTDSNSNKADQAITKLAATKLTNAAGLAGAKFYNYRVVDGKYELTTVVEGEKDTDWSDTRAIEDAKVEKISNFSNDATTYKANDNTVFLVAKGEAGEEQYYTYTGFKNVPEMASADGLAVGTNDAGNVAKYVYLSTVSYSDEVPEGYVFLYSKDCEADPNSDDNSVIDVIDQAGNTAKLTITNSLVDELGLGRVSGGASTSTVADWKDGNNAVGNFYRIDTIDEKGVVSKMTAMADLGTMAHVDSLGAGVITTTGDKICSDELDSDDFTSVDYDSVTKFVVIDLAVSDNNRENDASDDTLVFAGASTGIPAFNKKNIEDTPVAGTQKVADAQKMYDSVQVTAIHAENSTTADYVYVVRVVW